MAKQKVLIAIDPGTTESAYVMMRPDYSIISAAKVVNEGLRQLIMLGGADEMIIEVMEARTLNVGKGQRDMPPQKIGDETYETCYWIGRYMECAERLGMPVHRIKRQQEKSTLIPSKKNKLPPLPEWAGKGADAQIRAALVQRFAKHDTKNGKGTAACKDVFYGFKSDMWNAYAVGVTHLDRLRYDALKRRLKG